MGYCEQHLLLNYMGMRTDGSTTMRRGDDRLRVVLRPVQLRPARAGLRHNCVVVPTDLDLALLAPFGCGFQTGAGTVLNVLRPAAAESLVVFGAGAVGSLRSPPPAVRASGRSSPWTPWPPAAGWRRGTAPTALDPLADDPGAGPVADRVKELTGAGRRTPSTPRRCRRSCSRPSTRCAPAGRWSRTGLGAPGRPTRSTRSTCCRAGEGRPVLDRGRRRSVQMIARAGPQAGRGRVRRRPPRDDVPVRADRGRRSRTPPAARWSRRVARPGDRRRRGE